MVMAISGEKSEVTGKKSSPKKVHTHRNFRKLLGLEEWDQRLLDELKHPRKLGVKGKLRRREIYAAP